jgi:hypothetical protein
MANIRIAMEPQHSVPLSKTWEGASCQDNYKTYNSFHSLIVAVKPSVGDGDSTR